MYQVPVPGTYKAALIMRKMSYPARLDENTVLRCLIKTTTAQFLGRSKITGSRNKNTMSPSVEYTPIARLVDDDDEHKNLPYSVREEYAANIPEAQHLAWEDDFFVDDEDVIAVFDLDYELMRSYYERMGWCSYFCTLLYPPIFVLATVPALIPAFLKKNVEWNVNAQHVAVTRDGIRFVRDKRKSCWGLDCADKGKNSKTVPFDKITDCDVQEPAGNSCLIIKNVLSTVNIDTASSGGGSAEHVRHELQISGLKDPYAFKKLVWAMKRLRGDAPALISTAAHNGTLEMACRKAEVGGCSENDVTLLLREIRDELRSHKNAIINMQEQTKPAAAANHSGTLRSRHVE